MINPVCVCVCEATLHKRSKTVHSIAEEDSWKWVVVAKYPPTGDPLDLQEGPIHKHIPLAHLFAFLGYILPPPSSLPQHPFFSYRLLCLTAHPFLSLLLYPPAHPSPSQLYRSSGCTHYLSFPCLPAMPYLAFMVAAPCAASHKNIRTDG
uniref:Uncharacterized protein n=1 Tax=Sphaerodactylus townsendi TaxID=933632 RepID=A0ACB8GF70_9SAUR